MFNIDFQFSHLPGKTNVLADLLSRWEITTNPVGKLQKNHSRLYLDSHLPYPYIFEPFNIVHTSFSKFCMVLDLLP